MQILIIEDEDAIVGFLERGLKAHGHQVISADNGEDGATLALDPAVELVLLDIALPGLDGHRVLARVRALTRRADQQQATQLRAGDLRVDLLAHRVWRDGAVVDLSRREFALLEHLMRHPGQVLSRQQLLSAIWEYDFDPESNVVDVYIRYLRRKIDRPGRPSLITTVRGVGYRFEPPAGD